MAAPTRARHRGLAARRLAAAAALVLAPLAGARGEGSVRIGVARGRAAVRLSGPELGARPLREGAPPLALAGDRAEVRLSGEKVLLDGAEVEGSGVAFRAAGPIRCDGRLLGGEVEVRVGPGGLRVVDVVPLEDYVAAVAGAEMPPRFPPEALKAQAVAARTFAILRKVEASGEGRDYDLGPSVLDQVFPAGGALDPRARAAARATAGEVLAKDHRPVEAYFHSTCGGRTERGADALGRPLDYLPSVECDRCRASPRWRWTVRVPAADLSRARGSPPPPPPSGSSSAPAPAAPRRSRSRRGRGGGASGRRSSASSSATAACLPSPSRSGARTAPSCSTGGARATAPASASGERPGSPGRGRDTGRSSSATTRERRSRGCTDRAAARPARRRGPDVPVRTADFDYALPQSLVAQEPVTPRDASRLLVVPRRSRELAHLRFLDLPDLLAPGDLLVANDSRVLPARLVGRKASGGRAELLLVEPVEGGAPGVFRALGQSSKPLRPGVRLAFGTLRAEVEADEGEGLLHVRFDRSGAALDEALEREGLVPLPPYIRRPPSPEDRERYQTVLARVPGSAAAPTAGLHLTERLLARLAARGVERAAVTLHVGPATFLPVRAERVEDHRMHPERYRVGEEAARAFAACRARGGKVVAVGTTVVRALESAWEGGLLRAGEGRSALFITPGYRFRAVDALVTNFHLPRSTLLMLVCAFAGTSQVLAAYREAVSRGYRFYSYGDATLFI